MDVAALLSFLKQHPLFFKTASAEGGTTNLQSSIENLQWLRYSGIPKD
jgi:hypothetical protein